MLRETMLRFWIHSSAQTFESTIPPPPVPSPASPPFRPSYSETPCQRCTSQTKQRHSSRLVGASGSLSRGVYCFQPRQQKPEVPLRRRRSGGCGYGGRRVRTSVLCQSYAVSYGCGARARGLMCRERLRCAAVCGVESKERPEVSR